MTYDRHLSGILRNIYKIDINKLSTITGIGEGAISVVGEIVGELYWNIITFDFKVLPDDFPIPCDGILGLDFIKHFNCILDYKDNDNILILRPLNYNHIKIPINLSTSNYSMILIARSEVIRKLKEMFKY